ncbi:hypothetical protein DRW03_28700 [Corallococcus sp. H22C18031201]|uniref:hypothetical protein n=1 Tax=Citreicoccus inhibens TaxID=2849499 RepID=UPI000E74A230|nr:hypothetical protein [Citreicoccus inhibens]MBU8899472.1 hypothetical protein [Citreicoccus inhibens]RJS17047.1 hypothetical protein DRW03_28700 [Corallococcus sp. H22C18031201]
MGGASPSDGPRPKLLEVLDTLTRGLTTELGTLSEGLAPLLADIRRDISALEPAEGEAMPPPQEQEALRARIGASLDEAEDVLEALQLATRDSARGAG